MTEMQRRSPAPAGFARRLARVMIAVPPGPGTRERLIAAGGAFLGLALTGLLCGIVAGTGIATPLLVAPMGASAVILFALPASPMAQPWSILGGNVISALVGISIAIAIPNVTLAAALAAGAAIAAMSFLRCLHPPGGAVALTTVLGGVASARHPYLFALYPVGLNSLLLVASAVLFHRFSGHRYPHAPETSPAPHGTQDPAPLDRTGITLQDLEDVLARYGETLDISPHDLRALFKDAEIHASERDGSPLRASDIMSRDIVAVSPETSADKVWSLIHARDLLSVPVRNTDGTLRGLIHHRQLQGADMLTAGDIAIRPETAAPDTPVSHLVPRLADGRRREILIVDDLDRLVGIVTQTDVLAAIATHHLAASAGLVQPFSISSATSTIMSS